MDDEKWTLKVLCAYIVHEHCNCKYCNCNNLSRRFLGIVLVLLLLLLLFYYGHFLSEIKPD